ncbi:hypothetical protein CA267_002520 [Alteromonas pelagimontana]|uniref:Cxxc_20_cxxc protein n=1 Tax=Alteromonas pelagimontana TaxID=1858656 RepID=A0A6M4M9E5_9ALTE|nr:hypothetical protein [Alteromonas pelagimontana]QJR79747.1 hypothetical protein CA267_002520 [Alteromonas pelagimontana]
MKCPHCKDDISFFSRTLNKFGKERRCPHCNKRIKMKQSWKLLLLLIPLGIIFHFFILKPSAIAMGFSGNGLAALSGILPVLLSFRLFSDEPAE